MKEENLKPFQMFGQMEVAIHGKVRSLYQRCELVFEV